MTHEERIAYLEVASTIICKVHSDICRNFGRECDIPEDTQEIVRLIYVVESKLKEVKK